MSVFPIDWSHHSKDRPGDRKEDMEEMFSKHTPLWLCKPLQERITFKTFVQWHINLQALFQKDALHQCKGRVTHSGGTLTGVMPLGYSNIMF